MMRRKGISGVMVRKRWIRAVGVALAVAVASSASTAAAPLSVDAYDDSLFEQAQSAGRTVVIDSYASWCLPCRIQAPILARLKQEGSFAKIVILRVGEDSPKAVWRRFRLAGYGMVVVYRNRREVARGMPTTEVAMRKLLSAKP
jgi:thioredoxin 1